MKKIKNHINSAIIKLLCSDISLTYINEYHVHSGLYF